MKERVRVLVVDDSALMRKLIPMILERDPDIEVVGTAMDGAFALRKIAELHPDVVTLDLEMPRMDGIETLRMIMRSAPLPVIVFSTHSKRGRVLHFQSPCSRCHRFCCQAERCCCWPSGPRCLSTDRKNQSGQTRRRPKIAAQARCRSCLRTAKKRTRAALPPNRVIAIGISTGGPNALQYLLSQIPPDFPATFRRRSAHAGRFYGNVRAAPR